MKRQFIPRAPLVPPAWLTDNGEADVAALIAIHGIHKALQVAEEAHRPYRSRKSSAVAAVKLAMVVESLTFLSRQLREAEDDARVLREERNDKRRALVVKLLKALEKDYKASNDTDARLMHSALILVDSDTPVSDGEAIMDSLVGEGLLDFADLLNYAVQHADHEADTHYKQGDYGRMNTWNARGHAVDQLRRELQ